MFEKSDEDDTQCLGIIPGTLKKLKPSEGIRVPHMGWNTVIKRSDAPILASTPDDSHFYFVHSFPAQYRWRLDQIDKQHPKTQQNQVLKSFRFKNIYIRK